MEFFDVIRSRRSVREFLDKPVSSKDIETCLEAARLAPSASNSQPWKFLVARKPEVRAALAEAGYDQPVLKQAPVITVLLGDRDIFKKRLRRARELADIGAVSEETMASLEARYKAGAKQESGSAREANDMAIRANCMLAGEHYALAAAALELGCCWIGLFDAAKVTAALKLEEKYNFPVALLPTGYPAGEAVPPRPRYGMTDIAWKDETGRPWIAG